MGRGGGRYKRGSIPLATNAPPRYQFAKQSLKSWLATKVVKMSIVKESVEMKSALVWRLTRACRHRVEEMSNEVLIKYSDRQSSSQSFGKAVIESRDAY